MRNRMMFLLICPIFLLLNGCAQETIQHHILAYNQANIISSELKLLTSIVNAGRGHEPVFENHTEYQSQGMVSGTVSSSFMNVGGITKIFNLNPSLDIKSGIKQVTHKPLDFGGDYRALTNPVPISTLLRLTETEGLGTPLILTLISTKIEIRSDLDKKLFDLAENYCRNNPSDRRCKIYLAIDQHCRKGYKPPVRTPLSIPVQYINNPEIECQYSRFQALLMRLAFSLHGLQQNPKKKDNIQNIFLRLSKKPIRPGVMKFYMRSPADIINYLGKVTRLQNGIDGPRYITKIGGPSGLEFFRVVRGNGLPNKGILNVRDLNGDHYYIPNVKFLTRQTLRTLGILKRIVGRSISDKIRQDNVVVSTE